MNYKNILVGALFLVALSVLALTWQGANPVLSSVEVGNQYQSTTTPQVDDLTNLCESSLRTRSTGVLGSVNVLGTGSGNMLLLDATTTDVGDSGRAATSSLILAWYPDGFATTTNHFDIGFNDGLLVHYTGTATATISYRCEG